MTGTAEVDTEPRSSIRSRARSISQVQKWWASKIGPLLAVTFVALTLEPLPVSEGLLRTAAMIWSACMLATAAYVVNDWFDREVDHAIGKRTAAMGMSRSTVAGLYGLLLLLGILPWIALGLGAAGWAALAAIVVLPFLYSAPPLRWKTRGGLGLVADAGLAHVAPTAFTLAAFGALDPSNPAPVLVVAGGAIVWSAGLGFRSIISHEIVDLPSDQQAGVTTWVGEVGVRRATTAGTFVAFPVEVVGLVAVVAGLVPTTAVPLVVLVAVGASMLLARAVGAWPVPLLAVFTLEHDRAVLFLFYRFWLGATFLAGLVTVDRSYLVMAPIYLVLFLAVARDEVRSLVGGVRGLVRGSSWIIWGHVIRRFWNWSRYRAAPRIGDAWSTSTAAIGAWAAAFGRGVASGVASSWVALGCAWSAIVGGWRAAGRAIRSMWGTATRAVAAAAVASGRAIARAWAEVRRFTWRAWRKCRRTVLALVRTGR